MCVCVCVPGRVELPCTIDPSTVRHLSQKGAKPMHLSSHVLWPHGLLVRLKDEVKLSKMWQKLNKNMLFFSSKIFLCQKLSKLSLSHGFDTDKTRTQERERE